MAFVSDFSSLLSQKKTSTQTKNCWIWSKNWNPKLNTNTWTAVWKQADFRNSVSVSHKHTPFTHASDHQSSDRTSRHKHIRPNQVKAPPLFLFTRKINKCTHEASDIRALQNVWEISSWGNPVQTFNFCSVGKKRCICPLRKQQHKDVNEEKSWCSFWCSFTVRKPKMEREREKNIFFWIRVRTSTSLSVAAPQTGSLRSDRHLSQPPSHLSTRGGHAHLCLAPFHFP